MHACRPNIGGVTLKSRVFIGSSTESKHIANIVFQELTNDYECVLWYDSFFNLNQQTYEVLAKNAIAFDFAIYIGGKDDLVTRIECKTKKKSPRDNVYLEFGLYAGILSPARSFFIIHEDCEISSDLIGLTLLHFSDNEDSVVRCCDKIKVTLQQEKQKSRIQLLPSTSLAVGYYYNFLKILSQILCSANYNRLQKQVRYHFKKIELEILIPNDVGVDWESWALNFYRKVEAKKITLNGNLRSIGVVIDKRKLSHENVLHILDVPQTLRASFAAVNLVLGKDNIGPDKIEQAAKQREVDNFCATLRQLTKRDAYLSEILQIRRID